MIGHTEMCRLYGCVIFQSKMCKNGYIFEYLRIVNHLKVVKNHQISYGVTSDSSLIILKIVKTVGNVQKCLSKI